MEATEKLITKFQTKEDGLYLCDGGEAKRICSPVEVVALTRDENGNNWGRLIYLTDPDMNKKEIAIPMSLITASGGYLGLLSDCGLVMGKSDAKTKSLLTEYLSAPVEDRVKCVSRPGWYGGVYVLPNKTFGQGDDAKEKVILQNLELGESKVAVKGSMNEWQTKIGEYLAGNNRLIFAVSLALTPVLLDLVNEPEGGGFHFFGNSSIGKTTLLQVAGSVWGGGGVTGYPHTWRTTDNALEYTAEAHNDGLLCLDEMGQVDSRRVGEIAYMLANGEGKARGKKDGGTKRNPKWRLMFLSSGEMTLANKLAEAKLTAKTGMETRLIDIPADAGGEYGIYEEIHDFKDSKQMADHLKTSCQEAYGSLIMAFLEKLTAEPTRKEEIVRSIDNVRDSFMRTIDKEVDPQVHRVGRRFSLVAAAGELVIKLGLLKLDKFACKNACLKLFDEWQQHRGGTGSGEEEKIISQVKYFLQSNQAARFIHEGAEDAYKINNLAGYLKTFNSGQNVNNKVFVIQSEVFRKEICRGSDVKQVCKILSANNLLLKDKEGRYDKKVPIKGKTIRAYCVPEKILGECSQGSQEFPGYEDGDF